MLVDEEDFIAWLDHPITKWARDRFRLEAADLAQQQSEHLLNNSPSLKPEEWAQAQSQAAHLLGRCSGLMQFADLTYDMVREDDDESKESKA